MKNWGLPIHSQKGDTSLYENMYLESHEDMQNPTDVKFTSLKVDGLLHKNTVKVKFFICGYRLYNTPPDYPYIEFVGKWVELEPQQYFYYDMGTWYEDEEVPVDFWIGFLQRRSGDDVYLDFHFGNPQGHACQIWIEKIVVSDSEFDKEISFANPDYSETLQPYLRVARGAPIEPTIPVTPASATKNNTLIPITGGTVVINLEEGIFENTLTNTGNWITNLPAGFTQNAVRTNATTVTITVTGTATAVSTAQINVVIPIGSIVDRTTNLTVSGNVNARFDIPVLAIPLSALPNGTTITRDGLLNHHGEQLIFEVVGQNIDNMPANSTTLYSRNRLVTTVMFHAAASTYANGAFGQWLNNTMLPSMPLWFRNLLLPTTIRPRGFAHINEETVQSLFAVPGALLGDTQTGSFPETGSIPFLTVQTNRLRDLGGASGMWLATQFAANSVTIMQPAGTFQRMPPTNNFPIPVMCNMPNTTMVAVVPNPQGHYVIL